MKSLVDEDNNYIPVTGLLDSGFHALAATTSTHARNSTGFDAKTRIVWLYATEDMYIKFGGGTVQATNADHIFEKGMKMAFRVGTRQEQLYTHISALAVDTDGTLRISEAE